jgi:mutual gliding-motility protein MglA
MHRFMVLFNYSTKELTAKVVYYGPGLCGKTTNLQWIHEKLPIKNKGKMLSLATETDRTLFFDFLPIEIGTIRGMRTRIQLYTVPGQVFYNATRRMVLKGADCVVFVCDSQEPMLDANVESFENLRQNLEANEIDAEEIPMVFQYNKRDLPNALPIEIINERMNPKSYGYYEAVAVRGVGVEDTLKGVTKLVFKSLSAKYGTDASAGPAAAAAAPRPAAPPAAPSAPPVRPRAAAGAASPRPVGPPASHSTDELLEELDLSPAADAGGFGDAPELTFEDEEAPVPVAPRAMPAPPVNSRPDPKSTMISNRPEPADLRRRLAPTPPEIDMDLEHLGDGEQPLDDLALDADPLSALSPDDTAPPRSRAVPPLSRPPEPAPRVPLSAAPPAPPTSITVEVAPGQQQVDVPIEIKLPRAAGEVRVNLRMVIRSS